MDDNDFNNLINQGTKQIKLSSFSELKLQSDNKFKPKPRNDFEDMITSKAGVMDFLDEQHQQPIVQQDTTLDKKGSIGSSESEKEKKSTFGKFFGLKKLKSKISDPKIDTRLKNSMEKLAINDHNNISSPMSPINSDENYSPSSQVNRNTTHNAQFIDVEPFNPIRKAPSKEKGVTFRDAVSEIISERDEDSDESELDEYYDSYHEVQNEQQRPTFSNRGSSLKNLEHSTQKQATPPIPDMKPIVNNYNEAPSVPSRNLEQSNVNRNTEVPNVPNRMGSLPRGVKLAKKQLTLERVLPPTPKPSKPSIEQIDVKNGPRPQRSADLQLDSKPQYSAGPLSSRSFSELDQTIDNELRIFDSQRPPLDYKRNLQNATNVEVEQLKTEVEDLKLNMQEIEDENTKLRQQLEDQRKGFDKLSAQAYKKIKGLLTDRNILSIEVESLKSQVPLID